MSCDFSATRCPSQALDGAFLQYTIAGTIASSGQSVMLLFAFEYVILASTVVRYALKYGMSMVDLAMDGNWQGKVRGRGTDSCPTEFGGLPLEGRGGKGTSGSVMPRNGCSY